ncbi:MAG TPA: HPF/RaiA family ribosome-associated protein [Burkholderiaceae bacterium]|nr:HPF/RaiA family ribosome-associated protein [Burkholderiaceae bacterium]
MQVQVNTGNHIRGGDSMSAEVAGWVEQALDHFEDQLTRVELHLNDVNSHKGGEADVRCLIEARVSGHEPIAVTHHAPNVEQAVRQAASKMERALDAVIGKRQERARQGRP